MIPRVLAEVLQLTKRATPQQLTQQQEQPVDLPLLLPYDRPRRVLIVAETARRQHRIRPDLGGSVAHPALVLRHIFPYLGELHPRVEPHLVLLLAPPALHGPADVDDPLGEEVVESAYGGAACGSPRVYCRYELLFPWPQHHPRVCPYAYSPTACWRRLSMILDRGIG